MKQSRKRNRTGPGTRERLFAAAATEFAARGFAGANVDRIALAAKVNKAMLYYHFTSKQQLYHTLLRRMFTLVAERLQAIAAGPGTPARKVDRAIAAIAEAVQEHASFPAIMRFGLIPMFLFAGAFYPIDQLPAWLRPVAYVTPPAADGPAAGIPQAELANFLVAHYGYASPLVRRSVGAGLISDDEAAYADAEPPDSQPDP